MLEEREYIKTDFLASLDLDQQAQAMAQLESMEFIGDRFLTEGWVDTLLTSLHDVFASDGCASSQDELSRLRSSIFNRLSCLEQILKEYKHMTPELILKSRDVLIKLIEGVAVNSTAGSGAEGGGDEYDDIEEKGLIESDVEDKARSILRSLA